MTATTDEAARKRWALAIKDAPYCMRKVAEIAEVSGGMATQLEARAELLETNAGLLIAAPDMLTELRMYVVACECGNHKDGIEFYSGCPRCRSALQIIARAEGVV